MPIPKSSNKPTMGRGPSPAKEKAIKKAFFNAVKPKKRK